MYRSIDSSRDESISTWWEISKTKINLSWFTCGKKFIRHRDWYWTSTCCLLMKKSMFSSRSFINSNHWINETTNYHHYPPWTIHMNNRSLLPSFWLWIPIPLLIERQSGFAIDRETNSVCLSIYVLMCVCVCTHNIRMDFKWWNEVIIKCICLIDNWKTKINHEPLSFTLQRRFMDRLANDDVCVDVCVQS